MTTRPRRAPRTGGPRVPCPRCDTLIHREDGDPKRLRCPVCRYRMFDYPRPASGVIVLRGGDVLVLTRGHTPRRGYLDIPGGFIEAGESIEESARRELKEETGLDVGRLKYVGLYWDRYFLAGFGYFPTMNFYFVARWRSGVPLAADDAAHAEWMPIDELMRKRGRHAWKHMPQVVADVRRRLNAGSRARKGV